MNKHLVIYGRVQGVGFRYTAQQKALEYDLTGWVQNKLDGSVEMVVEGEEKQTYSYVEELKTGLNQFIQVDHIKINTYTENKGYKDFSIK
ncbi:acylphosphatase [Virgibacillus ainsalahensis]